MAADIEELKKRLEIFFNGNTELVIRYIEAYGPTLSMKNINELRSLIEKEKAAEEDDEGEDPVYEIAVECPVCKTSAIPFYELKAKSLFIYFDQFYAPLYAGINGFKSVNYTQMSVAVCPKCYFASPDKKDFRTFNLVTQQTNPSKLSPSILSELLETMGERLTIAEEIPNRAGLFEHPRSFQAAINSYRIALERVEVELRHRQPYSHYKKGAYWLKIALLQRQHSINDFAALEMAAEAFKKAFLNSDFPNANLEFQSVYTAFAIYMRLGRMDEARKYLQVMDQAKTDFESGHRKDPDVPVAVKTWKDRAMTLWESREDEDLWDIPKPKTSTRA